MRALALRYSSRYHTGHGQACDGECSQVECISCFARLWDCNGDYRVVSFADGPAGDEFFCASCQEEG